MRYVRAWETARREQNVLRYKLRMNGLEKALNNCSVREKNENCANSELTRYLTWRIAVSKFFSPQNLFPRKIHIRRVFR